jgi:hypothetical protein
MSPTSNTGPDAGAAPAPTARGDVPPAAAAASIRELCALRSSADGEAADSDEEDADGASKRVSPSAVASPLACDDAGDSASGGGSDEGVGDCGPTSGLMWALAEP